MSSEALAERFCDALNDLELQLIPKDVVDGIVSSEFSETNFENWESFPVNLHQKLDVVNKHLWKLQLASKRQSLWAILGQRRMRIEPLQVLLCRVFEAGSKASSSFNQRIACLNAIQLYFLMVKEPGSSSNGFFHEVLFEACFKAIKMSARTLAADDSSSSRKSKKKEQASKIVVEFSDSEGDENAAPPNSSQQQQQQRNNSTVVTLSSEQKVAVGVGLGRISKQLAEVLEMVSFKSFFTDILHHTIEAIVETLECSDESPLPRDLLTTPSSSQTSIETSLYRSLAALVHERQGSVEVVARRVCEELLMMTQRRCALVGNHATLPRPTVTSVANLFLFLRLLTDKHRPEEIQPVARHIVQNFIATCRDKSIFRVMMAQQTIRFLDSCDDDRFYLNMLRWILILVQNDKSTYVVNALYVIEGLLRTSRRAGYDVSEQQEEDEDGLRAEICSLHRQLFKFVVDYCKDLSITVRCRSLAVLASVLEGGKLDHKFVYQSLVPQRTGAECDLPSEEKMKEESAEVLVNVTMRRTTDASSLVRKSALQALGSVVINKYAPPTQPLLRTFKLSCRDPMLSARKISLQLITDILHVYGREDERVRWHWFKCAIPACIDVEVSLEEKSAQLLESVILQPIAGGGDPDKEEFAWTLLGIFTHIKRQKYRCYFEKLVSMWHDKSLVGVELIRKIQKQMRNPDMKPICWLLLRMLSVRKIKPQGGARKLFTKLISDNFTSDLDCDRPHLDPSDDYLNIYQRDVLCTVGQLAYLIEDRKQIIEFLKSKIETYRYPLSLVSLVIETIVNLVEAQDDGGDDDVAEWCGSLIQNCEEWLTKLQQHNDKHYDEQQLINRLHVASSAIQRAPKHACRRLVVHIEALLTDFTQHSRQDDGTQQSSQPLSQFYPSGSIPSHVRAHAMTALGKMCILNESLAKKCVGAIANEMESSSCVNMRNNALVILCDLTTVQTQLTNPYINAMATCLCDENVFIRKQCVILMSGLIKKEYIKWKGSLLFKFLFCANSGHPKVAKLTRDCLDEILKSESNVVGNFYYQNFVAAVFYFNLYHVKRVTGVELTEKDRRLFNLSGVDKCGERLNLYKYMLNCMEDYNRINLTRKIIDEIIEPFVKGSMKFDAKSSELLKDSLAVLCCKEIRLKCLSKKDDEEAEEENEQQQQMLAASQQQQRNKKKMVEVIKRNFVTQAVKRNLIENIFPHIIELKNMLSMRRSPLVSNVMMYLREVMSEYRDEVEMMLSQDQQLAKEVEFEMKQFEREQEELRQQQASLAAGGLSSAMTTPRPSAAKSTVASTTASTIRRKDRRSFSARQIINSARKSMRRSGGVGVTAAGSKTGCIIREEETTASSSSSVVVRSIFTNRKQNSPPHKQQKTDRVASTPVREITERSVLRSQDITFATQNDISVIPPPPTGSTQ